MGWQSGEEWRVQHQDIGLGLGGLVAGSVAQYCASPAACAEVARPSSATSGREILRQATQLGTEYGHERNHP